MDVLITKIHVTDAEDLFKFEIENRTFFEEMVPTRGNDYYNPKAFKKGMKHYLKNKIKEVPISF